jgi:hypothetical protein
VDLLGCDIREAGGEVHFGGDKVRAEGRVGVRILWEYGLAEELALVVEVFGTIQWGDRFVVSVVVLDDFPY